MKLITLFAVILLAGFTSCAPTTSSSSEGGDKVIVTEELFPEQFAVYTAEHDIVNIYVPLNQLNFEEDDESSTDDKSGTVLFFTEADIKENGEKDYKGLYIFKDGNATKLLENGRDAIAPSDESKLAYFAATDGIYVYNAEKGTAEKYGSLTDNLINIVRLNTTEDVFYVLNEDKELFKVTDDGNKKVKISEVSNADEIVLDTSDNLYYTSHKKVFVINEGGVKEIEGLPEERSDVKLLKPAFVIDEGIPAIINDKAYIVYANGTAEVTDFEFKVKPTAYSMEATLIQYYAYKKKIYEYNILAIILGDLLEDLKEFLDENKTEIQTYASSPKSKLRTRA